ncbi:MAG: hypothetical protein ACYCWE_09175 [Eubacteriales bacterium]
MLKKIIAALLLTLILASSLLSCAESDVQSVTTADQETVAETEEELYVADNLPADLDYGGKTITLLWSKDGGNFSDALDGDVVNDALYYRDRKVEERLNVTIKNVEELYTWAIKDEYLNRIKSSVLAGDNAYDIVSGQYATMPSLIAEGVYYNLINVEYLDLDMPWWVQGLIEETTINGKLYLVSGDITIKTISNISNLFFNKKMLADRNIEEPYDVVLNGDWTYDYFKNLLTDMYSDLNGNGKVDNEDTFGLIVPSGNYITPYIQAFNIKITTLDEEGYPVLTYGDEKTADVVTELCALLHDTNYAVIGDDNTAEDLIAIYYQNRSAFLSQTLQYAIALKNNESDFGVLPHPKYNEEQAEYYTALNEGNTLLGIVSSCTDTSMVSAVMECLASESYRQVSPSYYETALKVKYSRDDETSQMFDIIRAGVLFNFGSIYGFYMNQINTTFKAAIMSNNNKWASNFKSFSKAAEINIAKFYESVQQLP